MSATRRTRRRSDQKQYRWKVIHFILAGILKAAYDLTLWAIFRHVNLEDGQRAAEAFLIKRERHDDLN
jgi:hypothetical protein